MKDFEVGEIVEVYCRFAPFKAKVLKVTPTRLKVQFLTDGRVRWRRKSEVNKLDVSWEAGKSE